MRRVDEEDLAHAGDLGRGVGSGLCATPGDQHVHVTPAGQRRGDGVERRTLEFSVVVLGDDE